MTNERIDPITLPADADARALMLDLMRAATAYLSTSLARDEFSDDDCDYAPAASALLAATTRNFFLDDDPRDALLALITDDEFIADLDCAAADFYCDLMRTLNID